MKIEPSEDLSSRTGAVKSTSSVSLHDGMSGNGAPGVVFFGGFYPPALLERVSHESHGKIGFSNHNFEMSLIKGLSENVGDGLQIATLPKVYSYPHNNRSLYTRSEKFDVDGCEGRSAAFCNIVMLNKPWMMISAARMLRAALHRARGEGKRVWLIQNTPNFWNCMATRLACAGLRGRVTTCLITPDIPQMVETMGGERKGVKQRLVSWLNKRTMKMASRYGCHVLLTEAMTEYLDNPGPHIVMEGVIDASVTPTWQQESATRQAATAISGTAPEKILYSGSLRREFGVMNLVNAFIAGNFSDAELHICGSGDCAAEIARIASANPRVKFYGLVDSAEARRLQREATILVNPRTSEGEYTRYSFPSKTLEYLLAGKSTVINRLPGIPEEYYPYVFTPVDESVSALTECLRRVISTPAEERTLRAARGREFVINHKNARVQTGRILDLIKRVS